MAKVLFALALPVMFAASPASAANINECMSTRVIGSASVAQPGFAQRMRALRAQCHAAKNRYEAAGIVWSQYDRAYECVVGSFCSHD